MRLSNLKQIIPVALFFAGLGIIFLVGIGKFPKKLNPDLAEFKGNFQRRISSKPPEVKKENLSPEVVAHESHPSVEVPAHESHQSADDDDDDEEVEEKDHEGEKKSRSAWGQSTAEQPKQIAHDHGAGAPSQKSGVCQSVEIRGDGGPKSLVTPQEWSQVVDVFHHSKDLLISWMKSHSSQLPQGSAATLEKLVHELKIVQPVHASTEESDLSWRGIGVWVRDDQGSPLVLMGGGFLKLLKADPHRAAFEMIRLVAQSWSPCELSQHGVGPVWSPLLSCLGEVEEKDCSAEKSYENTWGISSSLAMTLETPGCQLPVFQDEKKKSCLRDLLERAQKTESKVEAQDHKNTNSTDKETKK